MKKLKKIGLAMAMTASLTLTAFLPNAAAATQHTVQTGDTLWKIAVKYGVNIQQLKTANKLSSNVIYPGQRFAIPQSKITEAEKDLMARLVHAEAKGEPYAGKVAVATVILNRVVSPDFPNTVSGVVNEVANGHYAFTPVQNGEIKNNADAESKKAVNEAIAFQGQGNGSLFFYNPKTAKSDWITTRQETITIGNHKFAK
ncbi:cell wall hydrolase [Mesobacillus maritimus]|uniref:cell wall hydrolase n=1 Tax=Mesobacillus maritimus TaxID=1643336 RepID=UPI002040E3F9|nr:cell wall hydrolase [Mesobacillus maritimus]MCM3670187.1 cell wall hydrolase [Mesobacillus maritimus]